MNLTAKFACIVCWLLMLPTLTFAQYKWKKSPVHTWIIGLGFNAVNDNPEIFDRFWFIDERWNAPYFPARLSVERNFKYGFAVGGNLSYNHYKSSKLVQGTVIESTGNFFSIDIYAKYRFNMNYKRAEWFDPYLTICSGYTTRLHPMFQNAMHLGFSVGSNFWLSKSIGIQLETGAKFGLGANFPTERTNYVQHSVSLLYRLYPSKRSKRPKPRYKWVKDKPKGNPNRM